MISINKIYGLLHNYNKRRKGYKGIDLYYMTAKCGESNGYLFKVVYKHSIFRERPPIHDIVYILDKILVVITMVGTIKDNQPNFIQKLIQVCNLDFSVSYNFNMYVFDKSTDIDIYSESISFGDDKYKKYISKS